ncbi:hypothetical protein PT2222_30177 [Paraburkholderia tropica]
MPMALSRVGKSAQQQSVVVELLVAILLEHAQQVGHVEAAALLAGHVEHHLALMQHHGALTVIERLAHAVRDHHRREFRFFDDARREFEHERGGLRIERGRVLVEQQNARWLQRRHQQTHGLALAAREQPDAVGQTIFQAQIQQPQLVAKQLAILLFQRRTEAAPLAARHRERHVLLDRERLAGARHRVLKHACDQMRAVPGLLLRDVLAVDRDRAFVDHLVAADRIEEGRFARAVRADHSHELAGRNLEREPAQRARLDRRAGIESESKVLCAEHGLASPVLAAKQLLARRGQHERDRHEHGGHEIQILRLEADEVAIERERNEEAIENRAEHGGERREHETARGQNAFTDDHRREADDDGADAHRNIRAALGLREQRTGECDERVRQRHARERGAAGGDALRARHARIRAGRAQRETVFGREEPVHAELRHAHDDEQRERAQHVVGQPRGLDHREDGGFGNERHVGRAHHAQIDRVERDHHQDAGEQIHDFQAYVEPTRDETGGGAREHRADGGEKRIVAAGDQRGRDGAAERKAAVDGQVGEVEDAKRDQHPEGDETEDQADLQRAQQRIEGHGESCCGLRRVDCGDVAGSVAAAACGPGEAARRRVRGCPGGPCGIDGGRPFPMGNAARATCSAVDPSCARGPYFTTEVASLSRSADSVTPCFCAAAGFTNSCSLLLVSEAIEPGFSPFRMRTTTLPV